MRFTWTFLGTAMIDRAQAAANDMPPMNRRKITDFLEGFGVLPGGRCLMWTDRPRRMTMHGTTAYKVADAGESLKNYATFLTTNSNGIPPKSRVILISVGETTPEYAMSNDMSPKATVTTKAILLPSILPFLIAIWVPSGPVVDPVSVVPSALNSKPTVTSPFGVASAPLHFPSTSAANAGDESSRRANASAYSFMGISPRRRF